MSHQGRHRANETLLLALACGATVENAARTGGVSMRTVYRRLKDPEFRQRLRAMKTDMVQHTSSLLTASGMGAAKTLLNLQNGSDSDSVRLTAARAILEQGARLREQAELEERVAALEQRVAERPAASWKK